MLRWSLLRHLIFFTVFTCAIPAFGIVIPSCYTTPADTTMTTQDCTTLDYAPGGAVFNTLSSQVSLTGVVLINAGFGDCSGVVISATQVLTAAHCFAGQSGVNADVSFGTQISNFTDLLGTSVVDPSYTNYPNCTANGDCFASGADLAIINLQGSLPAGTTIYQLFGGTYTDNSVNSAIIVAGFGSSGTGTTGQQGDDLTLRVGQNDYGTDGSTMLGSSLLGLTGVSSNILMGAFNNGVSNNPIPGSPSFNDEVDTAFGDSGGPSFYDGQIIGIHDIIACSTAYSVNPSSCGGVGPQSYYGEVFGDTSVEGNLTWIQSQLITSIPEPASWLLCIAAVLLFASLRRPSRESLRPL